MGPITATEVRKRERAWDKEKAKQSPELDALVQAVIKPIIDRVYKIF